MAPGGSPVRVPGRACVTNDGKSRAICEDERPLGAPDTQLAERCIHPYQLLGAPCALGTDVLRPRCEEEAIGLVLDPLAGVGPFRGCLERASFHEVIPPQPRERRAHVLRALVRQELGERGLVRSFLAPRPGENFDLGSGETRCLPRGDVGVVAYLPEPIYGGVELSEGPRGRVISAIPEREGRVQTLGRLGRLGRDEEGPIEKARQLRELFLWDRRERRVVRAGRLVHRCRESTALLGEVPAAVPLF